MSLTTFVIAACVFLFTLFVYLHHSSTPNQRTKRTARPPVQKFTFFSGNSREKMNLEDAILAVKQPISESATRSFRPIQATEELVIDGNTQTANSENFEASIENNQGKQQKERSDASELKETSVTEFDKQKANPKKVQQTDVLPMVKTVSEELLPNPKKENQLSR
jgi:hypothetical protein